MAVKTKQKKLLPIAHTDKRQRLGAKLDAYCFPPLFAGITRGFLFLSRFFSRRLIAQSNGFAVRYKLSAVLHPFITHFTSPAKSTILSKRRKAFSRGAA